MESTVSKTITLAAQDYAWIQSQIDSGNFDNESELIGELIQEHNGRVSESPEEIAAIKAALIEGEESVKKYGYSDKTVREIFEEEKAKFLARQNA